MASTRSSSLPSRGATDGEKRLEALALGRVAEAADAVASAACAGEVVRAIHAVASLLFPVDSEAVAGTVEEPFRSQVRLCDSLKALVNSFERNSDISTKYCDIHILDAVTVTLSNEERESWRHAFYHGPAFPTMSKILLGNVALKWLPKINVSARQEIYDSFFVKGPPTEVIQALVPALSEKEFSKEDHQTFCLNLERLLILWLLDNKGVFQIVVDFICSKKHGEDILSPDKTISVSRVAQLLASVPDKARLGASAALTSPSFFKHVVSQLLAGAEATTIELAADKEANEHYVLSSMFHFVGEVLSRVCRRGSTGVLVAELIPKVRNHIHRCVPPDHRATIPEMVQHVCQSQFWFNMVEAMRDQHSIERLTEELLRQLASQHISDEEAYWILWTLFNQSFKRLTVMR
ncbi:embryo defective 2423 [Zea mays]|uniref:Embryo defective 2423 n=1 Tax=Zea mays TaxID=4577 RepID=A0A1D6HCD1_MAIZE|nr:embryo defective 2423 [Zea mays]